MSKASKKIHFSASQSPTLGVEIELALVDKHSGILRSACPQILEAMAEEDREAGIDGMLC
ncbi:hypothetical protein OAF98_03495 [Planctomicrobium sp.]|nr:hypothetical protein [Planctomicrobium sp.]MDB4731336.1 hypothetical protein [bacterium]MDB4743527.1 hypothetical protein [Planctomicrobium sp.]